MPDKIILPNNTNPYKFIEANYNGISSSCSGHQHLATDHIIRKYQFTAYYNSNRRDTMEDNWTRFMKLQ